MNLQEPVARLRGNLEHQRLDETELIDFLTRSVGDSERLADCILVAGKLASLKTPQLVPRLEEALFLVLPLLKPEHLTEFDLEIGNIFRYLFLNSPSPLVLFTASFLSSAVETLPWGLTTSFTAEACKFALASGTLLPDPIAARLLSAEPFPIFVSSRPPLSPDTLGVLADVAALKFRKFLLAEKLLGLAQRMRPFKRALSEVSSDEERVSRDPRLDICKSVYSKKREDRGIDSFHGFLSACSSGDWQTGQQIWSRVNGSDRVKKRERAVLRGEKVYDLSEVWASEAVTNARAVRLLDFAAMLASVPVEEVMIACGCGSVNDLLALAEWTRDVHSMRSVIRVEEGFVVFDDREDCHW